MFILDLLQILKLGVYISDKTIGILKIDDSIDIQRYIETKRKRFGYV